MLVISIQSQVVHGYVGNSAAVFPMQAMGITVAAIPTVLFSNHPHYPTFHGDVLDDGLVRSLLCGVEERGLVDQAAVLLTGYLGTPSIAAIVANFVDRSLKRNPKLIYVCDPVMGDDDLGVFVPDGMLEAFQYQLAPAATVLTPNQYELELLSGFAARSPEGLTEATRRLRSAGTQMIVATGCTLSDTPSDTVETILCTSEGLDRTSTPRLPIRPCGTGDLLSALIAGHLAKGSQIESAVHSAVAETFTILQKTQAADSEEMILFG
ncbi:pyridoxal kinase [Brucella tritici]|uniref:pyridoxal kinase n=1 Tax=Brucella tritici TaxID=94626 RepID=A0A6L3YMQ9_9HYPH|nr:pyridoxal kinase [Brucella tritici]KAB2684376.1 pyridoxal kinase [Brucella tritici]